MSRNSTPAYRVEVEGNESFEMTNAIWRKHYGRPTEANAQKYVEKFNESLAPGGCNEHISKAYPTARMIGCRIVRQATGKVVASYRV